MKRWYQFYYEQVVIRQQLADEFEFSTLQRPIEENGHQLGDHLLPAENRQQPADELNMPELFGQIP